jgi:hypothetical protein
VVSASTAARWVLFSVASSSALVTPREIISPDCRNTAKIIVAIIDLAEYLWLIDFMRIEGGCAEFFKE